VSEIVPFSFDRLQVRVIVDLEGNPWWVAADVCAVLGIANVSDALTRLDVHDIGTADVVDSAGRRNPNTKIISESGLYTLLIRSRRPEAKPFRRWVTHEVLPALRRTGSYTVGQEVAPEPVVDPLDALQNMLDRLRQNRDMAVRALTGVADLNERVTAIESSPNWCTATGWAQRRGWAQTDLKSLARLGKRAAALARLRGLEESKVLDIHGRIEVHCWPLAIWDQATARFGAA